MGRCFTITQTADLEELKPRPEDIASQYAPAQLWEPFDDMARLSKEHIHDEIRTRYKLTPEQYLQANTLSVKAQPEGQQAEREAQRDHTEAERQSAAVVNAVVDGDVQNDVGTQKAATNAAES